MRFERTKSTAETELRVRKITSDILGIPLDKIQLKSRFIYDLDAKPMQTIELIMAFEEAFDLEIPDAEAENMVSVGDMVYYAIWHTPQEYEWLGSKEKQEERELEIVSTVLAFKIAEDGKIEVGLKGTDGSWIYVDGTKRLASGIYVAVFNRWVGVLKELEELVNSKAAKESDLQKFFERYPELLTGDDYDRIVPQAIIQPDNKKINWRADFVLHPSDQVRFCRIMELKLPAQPMIKNDQSGHSNFYYQLNAALQQLRDYGAAFASTSTRDNFKRAYDIDVFKPDLQLVVGRKWDVTQINTMLEKQRQESIEIVDWDTMIERLQRKYT